MNINEAINNLELIGMALENAANKPDNYNTEWAHYMEQMSWQMHRLSTELRSLDAFINL